MSDCQHAVVKRAKDPYEKEFADLWVCEQCGDEFVERAVSETAIAGVQEQSDDLIDLVTGVFSATLWDLHERAREAGQVQTGMAPDEQPLQEAVCDEKGHDRDPETGVCKRCGKSPFLGS